MQYPGRRRLPFRPFRWIVWVLLLLMAATLWMGILRALLLIPTPADVDQEHSYFSPLPATATRFFFRLNASLLGWRSGSVGSPGGFTSAQRGDLSGGDCVQFSSMPPPASPKSEMKTLNNYAEFAVRIWGGVPPGTEGAEASFIGRFMRWGSVESRINGESYLSPTDGVCSDAIRLSMAMMRGK